MLVMLLVVIMGSNSFWLLGKNQQYFDGVSKDKLDYDSPTASLWYVWNIIIGLSIWDSFFESHGLNKYLLITLSVIIVFLLVILLMNMLIAIMGDTFNNQSGVSEQIRTREHLQFIMNNYYLQDFAFEDP